MEWIRNMKLKKALFVMTFISLSAAALLSVISFCVCLHFSSKLASNMVEIRMDSGSLAVTESEEAVLSLQAVIAAELLSVLQIVLPIAFFVIAMVATASLFYRLKLKEPLEILTNSANRIMENDLNFFIETGTDDELGKLCSAFETMRQSLLKNNRELWRQAEERRRLNAAFSHDLRNPLTVLKGSVKMARQCAEKDIEGNSSKAKIICGNSMAEKNIGIRTIRENDIIEKNIIEKNVSADEFEEGGSSEKEDAENVSGIEGLEKGAAELLMENLIRMESYTNRIERYVEAMSSVGRLEEVAVERTPVDWSVLTGELENAMQFVVTDGGRQLSFSSSADRGVIYLDKNILFQIAENLVSNAVRFARNQISVRLILTDRTLSLEVADDGPGFPDELLKTGVKPFHKGNEDAEHFGMGLYICDLLCRKHGGYLKIENCQSGALVCAVLK